MSRMQDRELRITKPLAFMRSQRKVSLWPWVAMEPEREIVDRYRIRFMKEKTGTVFEGVISGVASFGFFVELRDVFVEGLVPVTSLRGDNYQYHEDRYILLGERTRRAFRIGDEVKVRVERVDVEKRHIDFGLVK